MGKGVQQNGMTMRKIRKNRFWYCLGVCALALISGSKVHALKLPVGAGKTYSNLGNAIAAVQPGDTIVVYAGTYNGGLAFANLKGQSTAWIYIMNAPSETVIFNGGGNAWQLSDAVYVHIKGMVFQKQTGNGFNLDDGGTYATPSKHVVFESCVFKDINATGNNDLLKLSGLDSFEIRNCAFLNGSAGGSGIDMVGCHDGRITGNTFENMGSNSIQAKGGCHRIRIEANIFRNGGQRAVNLGGSTGLAFFRPIDARYEAAFLKVYSNIFIGSEAPIAFVGCVQTEVANNTLYLPKKWVMRILQETVDTSRFYLCGNNRFVNNIIYKDNQVSTDCNIGPNTSPQSFVFSNNLWFHSDNNLWTGPVLPAAEQNRKLNQDPLFTAAGTGDFTLQKASPATGMGMNISDPLYDFAGKKYHNPRSSGAFEGADVLSHHEPGIRRAKPLLPFANPVANKLSVTHALLPCTVTLYNATGECVFRQQITTCETELPLKAGWYYLQLNSETQWYKLMVGQ